MRSSSAAVGTTTAGRAGGSLRCSVVLDDSRSPEHRAGEPVRGGIPEHGRVPRYYEVKAEMLALAQEMEEGALLPPERELAERYGVSRVTLRQAVGELVLEGKLQRRQGSRTAVAPPKLVQPLALVSYTEGVRSGLGRRGLPGRGVPARATSQRDGGRDGDAQSAEPKTAGQQRREKLDAGAYATLGSRRRAGPGEREEPGSSRGSGTDQRNP